VGPKDFLALFFLWLFYSLACRLGIMGITGIMRSNVMFYVIMIVVVGW
jgi:hypothetical protein